MKSLAQINFVKFTLWEVDKVTVHRQNPILPPPDDMDYQFIRRQDSGMNPPLGSGQLLSYFHSPSGAHSGRSLDYMPKRREPLLYVRGESGFKEGYGLHFVEGVSAVGVLLVVVVGIAASIISGVLYSIFYHDTSGGAGIGALCAAIIGIIVALATLLSKL